MITNHILATHPELEAELLNSFHADSMNLDTSLLQKYGFLNEEALSHISYVEELEMQTKVIVVLAFLLCFFLFLGVVLFFYFKREKRIKEIHKYLFCVLQNNYEVDLRDYQEDSLSYLKSDLLKVTNKLRNVSEISLKDKKNLERTLSDISHQLRTPLTSLAIINDVLGSKKVTLEERKKFLKQQKEQLERMEWLIVTLLRISQIDSGTIVFQKNCVDVKKMILEALKPSLIPLELKQISCEIDIPSALFCSLDFHWTVEAFINLIKNAMEHTNVLGRICISAEDNPLYVEIIVEDNGVGIASDEIPHIFERFYKGKGKSDSIGIGLNLAKTIIEKQNGTIRVESKVGIGTKFIIHFYKSVHVLQECMYVYPIPRAYRCQKRALYSLELELQMLGATIKVLGIEPHPLEEQPVLLTTELSFQPEP